MSKLGKSMVFNEKKLGINCLIEKQFIKYIQFEIGRPRATAHSPPLESQLDIHYITIQIIQLTPQHVF